MDLVLRATVVFLFVYLVTRVVGRRELSNLEPFDLIMLVVIGDLVQQGITQSDDSVTGSVIVLSTIALLTVGISYLNFRSRRLRPILDGEPIILVSDGNVIDRNMRRERITLEDLTEQARLQQIARLQDVRWAVLETSGDISFIRQESR
jgi:uncharacterized membrane protein YcaP (DUF421 family)